MVDGAQTNGRSGGIGGRCFARRWRIERLELSAWTFGDLQSSLQIGDVRGVPVIAYPGLEADREGGVSLRLFPTPEAAKDAMTDGYPALLERALEKEIAWSQKAVRKELNRVKLAFIGYLPPAAVERGADHQMRLLVREGGAPAELRKDDFEKTITEKTEQLRRWAPRFVDELERLLALRSQLRQAEDVNGICADALERLLPVTFLQTTPSAYFWDLKRYLEGTLLRLKKARHDPRKDLQRAERVQAYEKKGRPLASATPPFEAFRWALEDYRLALFAQEIGSPRKISERILDELWAALSSQKQEHGTSQAKAQTPPLASPKAAASQAPASPPKTRATASDLESLKKLFNR